MHDNALIVFDMDEQRSIEAEKQVDKHLEELKADIEAKKHWVQEPDRGEIDFYNNFYSNIKNDINSGDIILFELNKNMLEELNTITDFIKKKGINIVGLKELLSE